MRFMAICKSTTISRCTSIEPVWNKLNDSRPSFCRWGNWGQRGRSQFPNLWSSQRQGQDWVVFNVLSQLMPICASKKPWKFGIQGSCYLRVVRGELREEWSDLPRCAMESGGRTCPGVLSTAQQHPVGCWPMVTFQGKPRILLDTFGKYLCLGLL